ncbi:MAG: hypothetical protein A2289_01060 [Deltaproteobacteria bacterium RIFOXYA12_FULL_58_15]|nr:MAG: hypothetical protein A2289_01060 [Deltaproteobacteria bacterium RIFOXYA12_FULL_58_15]OGR14736.1 MAG: hypothetical protein A2341_05155 [Deltaproteobacteria bacterium RIFOXYB12_FULL_58_9]
MATVPFDLALSVGLGACVAVFGRSVAPEKTLLRSAGLWALVAFELMLFVPVGAFLLWRFPEWSWMYLLEADALPFPDFAVAAAYPAFAIASFILCRHLVSSGRFWLAVGVMIGGMAIAGLVGFFGWEQLSVSGTTEQFRADPGQMREVTESSLGYLLAASNVGIVVAWGAMLWRLLLLCRAAQLHPSAVSSSSVADQTPSNNGKKPAAGSKTRKKT